MTGSRETVRALFLVSLMILWLFAGTVAFAGSAAANEELIVDGDGSENNTFETLSDAVDSADQDATITVEPGTYEEEVISIDTAGLLIQTEGSASDTTLDTELGVEINSDDVVLDGFTVDVDDSIVDNGAAPGAVVASGDGAVISNNVINPAVDASASGVLVETDEITILDNEITGVEAGNSGGDVAFSDPTDPVLLNDRPFDADNERGIANEVFRGNDATGQSPDIGLVQVDDREFDTFLGIEHTGARTRFSSDVTTEVPVASPQGVNGLDFGGGIDRSIEIRHPSSGSRIEITPEDGEPTVETDRIGLTVTGPTGEINDDPELFLEGEEINVSITGDEDIYTGLDSTFAEFELALIEDGRVVDTSDERLIGIAYQGDIEQEGPEDNPTFTLPRDGEINEDWFVEFEVSDFSGDGPGTVIETDVENDDDDDFFDVTVDVSDLQAGEYNVGFNIFPNEGAGLSERIISISAINEIEIVDEGNFEITDIDVDDDAIVAGDDEIETTVTVENIGDPDTQDIELFVGFSGAGEELVDTESLSLDAGEETDVTLVYNTDVGDDPGVLLDIQTVNDRERVTAPVQSGTPEFRLEDLAVSGETAQDGEIDLEATVENIGGTEGTVDVEFEFGREIEFDDGDSTEITVGAGDTATATVSGTVQPEPRAGDHPVFVEASLSTDDGRVGVPTTLGTETSIDYGDIESGVDEAANDEQVLVTAGQYTETVTIDTEGVVVTGTESGVEIDAEGQETPVTLTADGTGISNVGIDDDIDTAAVSIDAAETAVVLSDIAGFETAVEITDGASDATLIGNNFVVDGMDPAVDVRASETSIIANVFAPDSEAADGDAIRLDDGASDTEIRDNTILTTTLNGNSPAAVSVGDDESLENTQITRNNFDALADDGLPVEGESPVDISVDPEEPTNELQAIDNYASDGELVLESDGINEAGTQDEPLSADLGFSDFDIEPDGTIEAGEEVTVSADIENDGEQTGSDTVLFDADGTELASRSATLDPDETEPVEFTFVPDSDDIEESPITLQLQLEDADVAVSDDIDIVEPAIVTVDETNVDQDEVTVDDDEVTVDATLENTGGVEASPTAELRVGPNIDGTEGTDYVVVASDDPTLSDGETAAIEFEDVTISSETIGDGVVQGVNEIGVATEDDSDAALLTVLSTPDIFEITIDDFDATVEDGDTVSVDVTVSNTGDEPGEQDVEFIVDGELESTQTFDLDDGDDESETFTFVADNDDIGTVPIEVASNDDSEVRTVTVEEASTGGSGSSGGGGGVSAPSDSTASVTSGEATSITDADPAAPGTTVSVGQTSVESITFEDDDVTGTASVSELADVPGDAPTLAPDRAVAAVFEIEVPDSQTDRSATLEFELTTDEVSDAGLDPDEIAVLRGVESEYQELDTDVTVADDTVTVVADTPGFSTFLVSSSESEPATPDQETETPEPETETPESDAETPEPETETPESEPEEQAGFGAVVALVALLAAVLIARRTR